jgi:hypothetical protein
MAKFVVDLPQFYHEECNKKLCIEVVLISGEHGYFLLRCNWYKEILVLTKPFDENHKKIIEGFDRRYCFLIGCFDLSGLKDRLEKVCEPRVLKFHYKTICPLKSIMVAVIHEEMRAFLIKNVLIPSSSSSKILIPKPEEKQQNKYSKQEVFDIISSYTGNKIISMEDMSPTPPKKKRATKKQLKPKEKENKDHLNNKKHNKLADGKQTELQVEKNQAVLKKLEKRPVKMTKPGKKQDKKEIKHRKIADGKQLELTIGVNIKNMRILPKTIVK